MIVRSFPFVLFLIACIPSIAQQQDYRTSEDALNRLLNSPSFIERLNNPGEAFSASDLNQLLGEIVPEYKNFRIDPAKINFENLYYANSQGLTPELLTNKLGELLRLQPAQVETLRGAITGNLNTTNYDVRDLSRQLGNSLYQRGKDERVDYAVDHAVDFFQSRFGSSPAASLLIDVGGGLLGGFLLKQQEKYDQQMQVMAALMVQNKFMTGEFDPGEQDLEAHYDANKKTEKREFDEAIALYNTAINGYRKNPERGYYLYTAYLSRAKCKMEKNAYRAAIIDYYFAETTLKNILGGKLPDKSVKAIYPPGYFNYGDKTTYMKGKAEFVPGKLSDRDLVPVLISRAYAKYRTGDYSGALADCNLATGELAKHGASFGRTQDHTQIIQSITGMAQFGLGNHEQAVRTFTGNEVFALLLSDDDNDGTPAYLDKDRAGVANVLDEAEGIPQLQVNYMPDYYPFDISQVRGLIFYKTKDFDNAIATYETICQIEEGVSTFWGAKNAFTKVGGDMSAVYSTLGNFYVAKGDRTKGLELLNKAISLNPTQLKYYASRANCKLMMNDMEGAQSDMNIINNPQLMNASVKSEDYYAKKITELTAVNNFQELDELAMEASETYPDNDIFFREVVKSINREKSAEKARQAASMLTKNKLQQYVLQYLQAKYSGDTKKKEENMTLAFENNLLFYIAEHYYKLNLKVEPFYCKLLQKYASKTNNTLHDPVKDPAKGRKELDSLYATLPQNFVNNMVQKQQNLLKEKLYAFNDGNFEAALNALNANPLTNDVPTFALEKIECLFILQRGPEAIQFAKKSRKSTAKTVSNATSMKGKMFEESNRLMWDLDQALENMAANHCDL